MPISRIPNVSLLSRFKGCVLAAACGDALGFPVERMSRQTIFSSFGYITNFVEKIGGKNNILVGAGQLSDDTILSKATMESIVEERRVNPENIFLKLSVAYTLDPRRGYGRATTHALEGKGTNQNSAGTGAAMRIHPIALFCFPNLEEMKESVIKVSLLTHTNQESIDGALAIAFAVALSVQGKLEPNEIIQQTIGFLGRTAEMSNKLREVDDLLRCPEVTVEDGLEYLGTRGYVLESVGSAFYSFLKTPYDLSSSLLNVVNAGGDTDTIASLTGMLSGSFNGLECISRKWLNKLELRSDLEFLSEQLFEMVNLRLLL